MRHINAELNEQLAMIDRVFRKIHKSIKFKETERCFSVYFSKTLMFDTIADSVYDKIKDDLEADNSGEGSASVIASVIKILGHLWTFLAIYEYLSMKIDNTSES